MYYLEIKDSHDNWSTDIGDYNSFENLMEVYEAIKMLEKEVLERSDVNKFSWRVLDGKGDVYKIIENNYAGIVNLKKQKII